VSSSSSPTTFAHGVHPHDSKERSAHLSLQRMPFVDRLVLPLRQHLGAPSKAVVSVGDRVTRGQLLAEAGGFVSTALHSPATGCVTAIEPRPFPSGGLAPSIEIQADPYASQRFAAREPIDIGRLSRQEFVQLIQNAGLVGLGGAAFPTHVKYAFPDDKPVRQLVVNGCECEPFLTCDHRVMVEQAEAIVRGTDIVVRILGVDEAIIGVELNKSDAIEALRAAIRPEQKIRVAPVRVKYPQGAEKMLIKALFGREVPAGKLPLDVEIVVNNVGTMIAIADMIDKGMPLIERALTVSGPGARQAGNWLVPIGTPVREVIRHAGGLTSDTRLVVMGGPMMGMPLASLDVPVLKGTSGILAFTEVEASPPTEYTCVRCGRCLEACANFLNPSRLARLARAERYEEMEEHLALDCMECGACTFSCPSGIPIAHLIRAGKVVIRERMAERMARDKAKTS